MKELTLLLSLMFRPRYAFEMFRDEHPYKGGVIALISALLTIGVAAFISMSLIRLPYDFSVTILIVTTVAVTANIFIYVIAMGGVFLLFRRCEILHGLLAFECFFQSLCAVAVVFIFLGGLLTDSMMGWCALPVFITFVLLISFSLWVLVWRVWAVRILCRVHLAAALSIIAALLVPSHYVSFLLGRTIEKHIVESISISDGAMFPSLLGKHRNVRCRKCGIKFAFDLLRDHAACPNCFSLQKTSNFKESPGDKVLVAKIFRGSAKLPQRWDLVTLESPLVDVECGDCGYRGNDVEADSAATCPRCNSKNIKKERHVFIRRVVGLPGDEVAIRNGDIYINGEIARKPPIIQKNMWIIVHDTSYASEDVMAWAWESADRGWYIGRHNRLHVNSELVPVPETHIRYKAVIFDRSIYNGYSGGNVVGDLRIIFDFTLDSHSGSVVAVLSEGKDIFSAYLRSLRNKTEVRIEISGDLIKVTQVPSIRFGRHTIDFSNVDDQIKLALDGREIIRYEYSSQLSKEDTAESGVEIGVIRAIATFWNVKIFRDVYYTNAAWMRSGRRINLENNEYFVLGDNSLTSNDSRFWGPISRGNLIGKVIFRYWPLHRIGKVR